MGHAQDFVQQLAQMGVKESVKAAKVVAKIDVQQHVQMDVIKHVQVDAETVVRTHV